MEREVRNEELSKRDEGGRERGRWWEKIKGIKQKEYEEKEYYEKREYLEAGKEGWGNRENERRGDKKARMVAKEGKVRKECGRRNIWG